MCVTSMVLGHYREKWGERDWFPHIMPDPVMSPQPTFRVLPMPEVSREEFNRLVEEVSELKKLFVRAKEYDARNNEPDCEMDEKIKLIRQVARLVGVDMNDVLGAKEEGGG